MIVPILAVAAVIGVVVYLNRDEDEPDDAGSTSSGGGYAPSSPQSSTPADKAAALVNANPGADTASLANQLYWALWPNCPQKLDPQNPGHAECIQNWVSAQALIEGAKSSPAPAAPTPTPGPQSDPGGLPSNVYLVQTVSDVLHVESNVSGALVAVSYKGDIAPYLSGAKVVAGSFPSVAFVITSDAFAVQLGGTGLAAPCGAGDVALLVSGYVNADDPEYLHCFSSAPTTAQVQSRLTAAAQAV